jgi:hypothetical protein
MIFTVLPFLLALLGTPPHGAPDLCPNAAMLCAKTEANTYVCTTNAQSSPNYEPQLKWSVSHGQVRGSRKSSSITVDLNNVRSETVAVRLKVHWRNVDKVCDVALTEKIDLRRSSQ